MKTLNELERAEQILTAKDMKEFVHPIAQLPTASEAYLGQAFVLSTFQDGYLPGKTYICVKDGTEFSWKLVNYHEFEPCTVPSNIWANCVRDEETGRATVYIHWKDPDDTETSHWDYSVLVKNKGRIPTSIYDGEIVGYSSVRDQYSKKQGFIDSIDADCVDDNDILEDLEIDLRIEYVQTTDTHRNINKQYYIKEGTTYREAKPKDFQDGDFKPGVMYYEDPNRYYYNVFAVSTFGEISGGEGCGPELTWKKFQELVQNGVAEYALSLGDIVQVRHDGLGCTIDLQVVAFDNNIPEGKEHSVTFMSHDVLFRGSFDHKETLYVRTPDVTWETYKIYFRKSDDVYETIRDRLLYPTIPQYEAAFGPVYERCYNSELQDAANNPSLFGRNTWKDSNARQWLNSDKPTSDWFEPQHIFDTYSDNVEAEGSYGVPVIAGQQPTRKLFGGFRYGLEEELQEVMAKVKIKTTQPVWARPAGTEGNPLDEITEDWVFLPAYIELFGHDEAFPLDVSEEEGKQFDIYALQIAKTRMKNVLRRFNTTTAGEKDILDNLASWWMRTPTRMKQRDPGPNTFTENEIDCVEIVTNEERRYDVDHQLGEDGGAGRQPYLQGADMSTQGKTDLPRDTRRDSWIPVGTSLTFVNNTSPGFVPCLVVA